MKAKVTEGKSQEVFTPFEMRIRVENIDELKLLWHKFNTNKHFKSNSFGNYTYNPDNISIIDNDELWAIVNRELLKYEG